MYKRQELTPLVWQAGGKDLLYSAKLRFYYEEHDILGGVELRYVDINMGTLESDFGGDDLALSLNGELFFERIKDDEHIRTTDLDQIDKRVVKHIEFLMSVANPTLKTYIDLNEPLNGIVQDRPSFTNIDGGRGVFASRFTKVIDKSKFGSAIGLNKHSIEELFNTGLKFCSDEFKFSPTGADPQDFYCP